MSNGYGGYGGYGGGGQQGGGGNYGGSGQQGGGPGGGRYGGGYGGNNGNGQGGGAGGYGEDQNDDMANAGPERGGGYGMNGGYGNNPGYGRPPPPRGLPARSPGPPSGISSQSGASAGRTPPPQYGVSQGPPGYGNSPSQRYNGPPNPFADEQDLGDRPSTGRMPPPGAFGAGPRPPQSAKRSPTGTSKPSSPAMEMQTFNPDKPVDIFAQIEEMTNRVDEIERQLSALESTYLSKQIDAGSVREQEDNTFAAVRSIQKDLVAQYRQVATQLSTMPNKGNYERQAKLVHDRIEAVPQKIIELENKIRTARRAEIERQYKIVNGSDAQFDEFMENPGPIFQQSLMQRNRMGQAQSVLSDVQQMNQQLAYIEQQIMDIAQMSQDLDRLLEVQEAQIDKIEQVAETVVQDLDEGKQQVDKAIDSAKSRRKWGRRAVCIGVLIVLVIVIIVIIYLFVTGKIGGKNNNNNNGNNNGNNNNNNNSNQNNQNNQNTNNNNQNANTNSDGSTTTSGKTRRSIFERDLTSDVKMTEARAVDWAGQQPDTRPLLTARIVVPEQQFDDKAASAARYVGSGPAHALAIRRREAA